MGAEGSAEEAMTRTEAIIRRVTEIYGTVPLCVEQWAEACLARGSVWIVHDDGKMIEADPWESSGAVLKYLTGCWEWNRKVAKRSKKRPHGL